MQCLHISGTNTIEQPMQAEASGYEYHRSIMLSTKTLKSAFPNTEAMNIFRCFAEHPVDPGDSSPC